MKPVKIKTLRTVALVLVGVLVSSGLAFHNGLGTPSAWGVGLFNAVCPLGALETMIAGKTLISPVILGMGLVVAATVLVGKAFCAWGCPVPPLQRLLKGKKRSAGAQGAEPSRSVAADSRFWVLIGAVISTAVAGFPVFCLVCPIGLTFATLAALWHLFQFNEAGLSLIVFPAILALELLVLRKWCGRFCPVGALLSLISRANRSWRPTVDAARCLKGSENPASCGRCAEGCPAAINLHAANAPLHECTKCGNCSDRCPTGAIGFPFLGTSLRTAEKEPDPVIDDEAVRTIR